MTQHDAQSTHAQSTGHLDAAALRAHLDPILPRVLGTLGELVAIPSIAWSSHDRAQVSASAEAVARLAGEVGFETVEILTAAGPDGSEGYPAVVASRPAPAGRPTVVLYAHHDVQPTGDEALWTTPPFVATAVGDRLYGRGAADDKAGIMVHLTALELLGERLGVGVVLFVEGEEEAGSPSFRNFLVQYREKLAGDVIVVADSGNWAPGVPALTSSLRGMASLEFTVRTLDHAVHSGMFGGPLPDAMLVMTRVLAGLHHPTGAVAVDGLVRHDSTDVDYTETEVRRDSGILPGTELVGTGSLAARLWMQPAITVIGIDVPDVDHSSNTLQAAMRAKLSIRLAPGDHPERALAAVKRHLTEHAPFGALIEFGPEESGRPWSADTADPVIAIARQALTDGYGQDSVLMGLGGSIPFIGDLLDVFPQASILVTGVEDPDARAHSANESLYLPDFASAIIAETLLLDRLAHGVQGGE